MKNNYFTNFRDVPIPSPYTFHGIPYPVKLTYIHQNARKSINKLKLEPFIEVDDHCRSVAHKYVFHDISKKLMQKL